MGQPIPKHPASLNGQSNRILRLRLNELESATNLVAESFADDPSIHAILPGAPRNQIMTVLKKYVEHLITDGMQHGCVKVMKIKNKLVAVMIYFPPQTSAPPRRPTLRSLIHTYSFLRLMGITALIRLLHLTKAMEFKRPTTPHYYIELGCVARGQQHKGIGRQMAQHVFNQAKRSGCGVYAETFNANNLPLLQRLGYKITNHPKSRPLNFWSLWRAPR